MRLPFTDKELKLIENKRGSYLDKVKLVTKMPREVYWANDSWSISAPIEITGLEHYKDDRKIILSARSKNSGIALGSCSMTFPKNNEDPKPDSQNGGSISMAINCEPSTQDAESTEDKTYKFFLQSFSMNYQGSTHKSGVRDQFHNGVLDLELKVYQVDSSEVTVLDNVSFKDMSQTAIDARRIREDAVYTRVKFWSTLLFAIPAKGFMIYWALTFAVFKNPEITQSINWLSYFK